MDQPVAFGQLKVRVGKAPPVYDPGGDTWAITGTGPASDFALVEAAAMAAGAAQVVVTRVFPGELIPSGYEPVSDFWVGVVRGGGGADPADEGDLPFMLDLAAQRRAEYGIIQPVFWREAREARPNQERWFRHLLREGSARVLRDACGFLIGMPRGNGWVVDDFCVRASSDWATSGQRLLTTLEGDVEVVCACHDAPKQALVRRLGLRPSHTWFQKALRASS